MRIAEARPFLDEYLGTPQELKLLRRAKIKAVTYSNQIEGNHLGESEVDSVLKGKKVKGTAEEIKEIANYRTALDYVEKLAEDKRKLKPSDFCDIQRLVTDAVSWRKSKSGDFAPFLCPSSTPPPESRLMNVRSPICSRTLLVICGGGWTAAKESTRLSWHSGFTISQSRSIPSRTEMVGPSG
jgi:hypothetical protein